MTGKPADLTEPGEVLDPKQKPLVPKDAATLVILDRAGAEPRVLMGKRRADLAFMAGKYVFPGGRVDPEDKIVATSSELRAAEVTKLMVQMRGKPSAVRARGLALAAIREAYEEAGLIVGGKTAAETSAIKSWDGFFKRGFRPALAPLTFFARAITPPGRPRRFDTRFFCMDATAISERLGHNDGELSGLDWLTLDAARELDLPRITRLVLEDLQEQLEDGSLDAGTNPVPFYYQKNASFKRDLIRVG
jgi:8-oxo-dGTP pyrophosphatase MutT (NUDIX family)